ncbi:MAG: squalene/phytoene synthase family protein [Chthoniobacterales bacterium]|nr:squalene/phytoene synthase family protein [Chthoniobacterales bacterium]
MMLILTKKVARSFYLSIRLLPSTLCEPVALAYLLARASDTIVDEEDDSIKESERELVRLLPSLIEELNDPERNRFDADAIKVVWQTILEGQRFDLEKFSPQNQDAALTPDELNRYLYLVAGCVGEFWTKLAAHHFPGFSKESLEMMMARGIDYGKGLQLVNILRDRQEDASRGRRYCAEDQVAQLHVQALAYLQQGEAYVKVLRPGRFKVATALPLLLGKRTLALVKKYPAAEKVKISRWEVYGTLLRASRYLFW